MALNPLTVGQTQAPSALSFKPIGLRCKNTHPTQLSDGVNTNGIYRILHQVAQFGSGDQWKLVYGNRLSETANTNSITISAVIEYPAGTFHTVTWSSATSVTITGGGADVYSDAIPVAIPAGAQFYTRTLVSVASAGQKWPTMDVLQLASAQGDSATLATGTLPSITGALTPSNSATAFGPVAILGRTAAPNAVVLIGDSIVSGNGDTQTNLATGYISRALNLEWPILCVAQSGEAASIALGAGTGFAANHVHRKALIQGCGITHAIINYGNNDLGGSASSATVISALQVIYNLLFSLGITVINGTIGTRSTSTDQFKTLANQTVTAEFTPSSQIDTCNAFVKGLPSPVAYTYDVNAAIRDPSTYKWVANGTAYISCLSDGIHPSANAGYGHSAMAALLLPILNFLPGPSPAQPAIFGQANLDWNAEALPKQGYVNGNSVSSWADSILGLAATSATNQPTFVTGATPEGQPVVRFASASSQILTAAANAAHSNIWTNNAYMLLAIRPNSIGATNGDVYSKSSTNRLCMNSTAQMNFEPQFTTTSPTFLPNTPTAGASAWIVMSILYNSAVPGTAYITVNGTTYTLSGTAVGTLFNDAASTFVIGNRTDGTRGWDGDIMRMTIWKNAPTVAQQAQAYNWLRGRMGV